MLLLKPTATTEYRLGHCLNSLGTWLWSAEFATRETHIDRDQRLSSEQRDRQTETARDRERDIERQRQKVTDRDKET